ncbi:histidine kinase [Streptomyces sp. T-3]|nr:histidine kinase [Streptomyces sp. T-3]
MSTHCTAVSEALAALEENVIEDFRKALREHHNTLAEPLMWDECQRQARAIFADCVQSLRRPWDDLDDRAIDFSEHVGMHRAAQGMNPAVSIQACTVLFDTALPYLRTAVSEAPAEQTEEFLAVSFRTFHKSIGRRMEAAMQAYHSFLLQQAGEANCEVRLGMARDIHDHVGNSLATAMRRLEIAEAEAANDPGRPGSRHVQDAYNSVQDAMDYTRGLVRGLRMRVPDTGLESSLRAFMESVDPEPVRCDVLVTGDEEWVQQELRYELFIALRECLRNALAHAAATAITVEIDIAPHEVHAEVRDNGTGFDVAAVTGSASAGGGLASVRERVRLVDGTVRWRSSATDGTRVVFRIPNLRKIQAVAGMTA